MITGALPYSGGDVRFRGDSLRGRPSYAIGRLGVSRTFQIVKPFRNLTVVENVMVGALFGAHGGARALAVARRRAEEVLDFVSLTHRAGAPADGLNVPERKRMELARALVTDPNGTVINVMSHIGGLNQTKPPRDLERRLFENGDLCSEIVSVSLACR